VERLELSDELKRGLPVAAVIALAGEDRLGLASPHLKGDLPQEALLEQPGDLLRLLAVEGALRDRGH
jgi:hypothetical protein